LQYSKYVLGIESPYPISRTPNPIQKASLILHTLLSHSNLGRSKVSI
jgi:hypothetical protein